LVEVKEPSQYYLEEDHEKIKSEVNGIIVEGRVNGDAIRRQETLVAQLEKGSICPTCNRPLDQVDHTDEINKIKEEIEKLKGIQKDNENKLTEANEREKVFSNLKREYDEYEKNKLKKARYELEAEQKQTEIDRIQVKLDNYDRNKQKLDENVKI